MSTSSDLMRFPVGQHLQIGGFQLDTKTLVAPMAGVTDRPFRLLCKNLGARYAVSEMITSDPSLFHSRKSVLRRQHDDEAAPIVVQIAGAEPDYLAEAACFNVNQGAQIIDINMGCPAKKVCKKAAGSALLSDEKLVARCLNAVTLAVDVPVTLKIRTGTCPNHRNAVNIARLAEQAGIQMLVVHGRTRVQKYQGEAEYDTIQDVVSSVKIPVVANGDINTPHQALNVLNKTGANAVMIGRAGQGRPWLYQQIDHFLATKTLLPEPSLESISTWLIKHVRALHHFYGERQGLRVARKHIGWYLQATGKILTPMQEQAKQTLLRVDSAIDQLNAIETLLVSLASIQATEQTIDQVTSETVSTHSSTHTPSLQEAA